MTESCLQSLPPELLDLVLEYLPISSLLAFGQTSKTNYRSATAALTHLELAVLPKRIHSVLAFLNGKFQDEHDRDERCVTTDDIQKQRASIRRIRRMSKITRLNRELYQIGLTTPPTSITQPLEATLAFAPPKCESHGVRQNHSTCRRSHRTSPATLRTAQITSQNKTAYTTLSTSSLTNLKSLTLHLYTLTSSQLSTHLAASFPSLRHLALNFSHPYINDNTLPPSYWRDTPTSDRGSTAWNAFAGIGTENERNLSLRGLKTLRLSGAAITSKQLQSWVSKNDGLRILECEKVRGVDVEFVDWLSQRRKKLDIIGIEKVVLNDCSHLVMKTRGDFKWIKRLLRRRNGDLRELNLRGCKNVDEEMMLRCARNIGRGFMDTRNQAEGVIDDMDDNDDDDIDDNYDEDETEYENEGNINTLTNFDNMTLHSNNNTAIHRQYQHQYRHQYQYQDETHQPTTLITPKGLIIRDGQIITHSTNTNTSATSSTSNNDTSLIPTLNSDTRRIGLRSPALTISEGSDGREGNNSGNGGFWKVGEIEVDPDL